MYQYVYTVTMYRYGDREMHSYVLGVYTDEQQALKEAEAEREYRGGNKYIPEILKVQMDRAAGERFTRHPAILPLECIFDRLEAAFQKGKI